MIANVVLMRTAVRLLAVVLMLGAAVAFLAPINSYQGDGDVACGHWWRPATVTVAIGPATSTQSGQDQPAVEDACSGSAYRPREIAFSALLTSGLLATFTSVGMTRRDRRSAQGPSGGHSVARP